jgi:hypothetical protein
MYIQEDKLIFLNRIQIFQIIDNFSLKNKIRDKNS